MVVKVGFSWLAFIFCPWWFLLNGMWLNFLLVASFVISAWFYFEYQELTSQSDALLFIVMYLLYLMTWFLVGKFANALLCSDLKEKGYVLKVTVAAKNVSHAREEAAAISHRNETIVA